MKAGRPALCVVADRDGTLIEHHDYLSDPRQVRLLPGVAGAVDELRRRGIPFAVHTNQSGVARGYFPFSRVVACQQRLFELLGLKACALAGWCIAPEAPGTPGGYRKPSPRFIHELCAHLQLEPDRCHMIGDTRADLAAAWNAGASAWHVACGKAGPIGPARKPFQTEADFAACVRRIIGNDTAG